MPSPIGLSQVTSGDLYAAVTFSPSSQSSRRFASGLSPGPPRTPGILRDDQLDSSGVVLHVGADDLPVPPGSCAAVAGPVEDGRVEVRIEVKVALLPTKRAGVECRQQRRPALDGWFGVEIVGQPLARSRRRGRPGCVRLLDQATMLLAGDPSGWATDYGGQQLAREHEHRAPHRELLDQ